MTVKEFEAAVLEREGIVIRVRASATAEVENYDYERQATAETSVTQWKNARITDKLRGHQVSVLDGRGREVNGKTRLWRVRESYVRE